MKTLKTLLDKACKSAGNSTALAKETGLTPSQITDFRSGRKAISPATVGVLCDYLKLSGDEAREWLAVSVVESAKDPEKAGVLRRAFFVSWSGFGLLAGIVGALITGVPSSAEASVAPASIDALSLASQGQIATAPTCPQTRASTEFSSARLYIMSTTGTSFCPTSL